MKVLEVVLLSIGGSSVLILMAALLAKKFLIQLLAKDLENYKSSLLYKNSIELEKFKRELSDKSILNKHKIQKLEELHQLLNDIYFPYYNDYSKTRIPHVDT